MSLKHILIVDDDQAICSLIAKFLLQQGYAVNTVSSTIEAELMLSEFQFDAIILDVLMPQESGIEFIIRKKLTIPVLMLTALGDVDDRINGLESGADDYLPKPFEAKELLLRLQKMMNRVVAHTNNVQNVHFGPFCFSLNTMQLTRAGQFIYLTSNEGMVLKTLAENLNQIVSREKVAQCLGEINVRTVDTQIARVRAKIEEKPRIPQYLYTVRNKGYMLRK